MSQPSEDAAAVSRRLREAISIAVVNLAQMEFHYRGTQMDEVSDEARNIRQALAAAIMDAPRKHER